MDVQKFNSPTVEFSGWRSTLLGILLRGYLLMLPTLGIYRFWLVTQKRRFYWSHTKIDGDALEYTGTAKQLFIGFLIAVAVFLPLYLIVFWAGTQSPQIAVAASIAFSVIIYFLIGYALYRSRRFRLSRTLWRGIRFGQGGNAWSYAFRRFGWSILMILTLGLVYPFMQSNLWRYRFNNTWYGDRRFAISGTWRTIAGPFYKVYFGAIALLAALGIGIYAASPANAEGVMAALVPLAFLIIGGLGFVYLQARIASRMYSSVTAGDAALAVNLKARSLVGMYVLYGLMLTAALFVFGLVGGLSVAMFAGGFQPTATAPIAFMVLSGIGYVLFIGVSSLVAELYLGFGYWKLLANNAHIENVEDLRNVRAQGEESPVLGEGLADALDVGAY